MKYLYIFNCKLVYLGNWFQCTRFGFQSNTGAYRVQGHTGSTHIKHFLTSHYILA